MGRLCLVLGFPTGEDSCPGDSSPLLWELEPFWNCASQLPTAALGAFQGCGVGIGLLLHSLLPHLSVINISALDLHSGLGREGFSEPLGQGWVPEWEQDWEHSLSLVGLAAPPDEGETEARAGVEGKPESDTSSVVFLSHLFIFLRVPQALLFCKPRVFRKRRAGEVLQAQGTCTCLLKQSLTSGPAGCSCHCHLPLPACKGCHRGWPGGRKGQPCPEFAWVWAGR